MEKIKLCTPQETAKRIKEAMYQRRISAAELSRRTGISAPNISMYVNGRTIPRNTNAVEIGRVLNVSPMWLMGFEVNPDGSVIEEKHDEPFNVTDKPDYLDIRKRNIHYHVNYKEPISTETDGQPDLYKQIVIESSNMDNDQLRRLLEYVRLLKNQKE